MDGPFEVFFSFFFQWILLKCLSVEGRFIGERRICKERMDGEYESHGWIRLCGSSASLLSYPPN